MCCYLPALEGVKEADTWCQHCTKHSCEIYDFRPRACREFACSWLHSDKIPNHWYPKKARMVLYSDVWDDGPVIIILVDPKYPIRWREQPYYGDLKNWSGKALSNNPRGYVHVFCKQDHWFILPDREIHNPLPGIIRQRGDGINYDYLSTESAEKSNAILQLDKWLNAAGIDVSSSSINLLKLIK